MDRVVGGCAKDGGNPSAGRGMLGASFTRTTLGQAPAERLALKPYWGNPPYGILGDAVETSASFEARSAPLPYPTCLGVHHITPGLIPLTRG